MTLDNIKDEIEKAKTVVILTHEYPDGDAIGSSLAMYNALIKKGKEVDVVIPEFPRTFDFLPGVEAVKSEYKENCIYDLAISLDCSDAQRLKGFEECYDDAKCKISIDHHGTNSMYGDYNYVDPACPACAQLLMIVFKFIGVEIDKDIGTCLLTGIATDTGGFTYSGVTTETYEFVAELLRTGVNLFEICRRVLRVKSRANFELSKLIMDRIEFFEEGKIAFSYITLEDQKNKNAEAGDHEGLVDIGRDIEGVEVSIFLREIENGFKVSLRSNQYLNVAEICSIFGGGGHPRAAGCKLHFPLEQSKEKIIDMVKSKI